MKHSNQRMKLSRDQRGTVLPLFALFLFFFLVLFVGVAFDFGRQQIAQSKAKNALDAAALAMATVPNIAARQAMAQAVFDANFPTGYMHTTLTPVTVTNLGGNQIALSVSGKMETTFLKYGSPHSGQWNELDIGGETEVAFAKGTQGMEMALVFDVTGSMSGKPIQDLKDATNGMLDIIYGGNSVLKDVWIGIVPFTISVNADLAFKDVKMVIKAAEVKAKDNVLRERFGKDGSTPPQPFEESEQPVDINVDSTKFSLIPTGQRLTPMLPMVSNINKVKINVNKMAAGGNTNVVPGALWGWRMLSPQWRGIWAHEDAKLPLDYGTPAMKKVAIIMTDGASNQGLYNANNPSNRLDSIIPTFNNICTNMKNKGIEIYTVAFRLTGGAPDIVRIKNSLKACASTPAYYFDSTTGAKLKLDFQLIGQNLAKLRISK